MKVLIISIFLFLHFQVHSQTRVPEINPQPLNYKFNNGIFILNDSTKIEIKKYSQRASDFFKNYLKKYYGISLKVQSSDKNVLKSNSIVFNLIDSTIKTGGYLLKINNKEISISASDEEGLFNGMQSVIQLLPISKTNNSLVLPGIEINDEPRFLYRGVELDVSRHFFDVDYIKRFIDYLALQKINKFHWHLTDDQGWRIEIKKYPLLTEVGGCRDQTLVGRFGTGIYDSTPYCHFYSQQEIKEIVKYAEERFISIIPEIDMPGHTTAMLASYPFLGCTKGPYKVSQTWGVHKEVLCAGNDSTYHFIENVLDEVINLFPSKIIHIGGDECLKERWKECPVCQKRMKDEGLKNEVGLQSYFIKRVSDYLKSKNKSIVGWDEILDGGASEDAIIMNWRGEKIGIEAARKNHKVIMTPERPLYLNFQQSSNEDSLTQGSLNTLEAVYNFDPVPELLNPEERKLIIGTQANFWTEYISNPRKLEYMAFPRLSAFAEVAWTNPQNKNWENFERHIPKIMQRYKLLGINYSDAFYDLQPEILIKDNKIFWKLSGKRKGSIKYFIPGSNTPENYNGPIEINKEGNWKAFIEDSTKQRGNYLSRDFKLNKASGKKITLKNDPNSMYFQQGANTLVDGIQNIEGMVNAGKFLGFLGKNLEATVDLGHILPVNTIILRTFEQVESWIYRPKFVEIFYSIDGVKWISLNNIITTGIKNIEYVASQNINARYIKIVALPHGIIEKGQPGAGHQSWIFSDEIIVY